MVLSHVYSNWRVRQALLNSNPRPGNNCSTRAKTGRGSKIGKASNAMALIFGTSDRPIARDDVARTLVAATPATMGTNSRRLIGMTQGSRKNRACNVKSKAEPTEGRIARLRFGDCWSHWMRGKKDSQVSVACLLNVETMIPKDHPIRAIKGILGVVLREMDEHFEEMYAESGRPSIPPERLLLSKVLMALYTIRSERQFCERLQYDLLFRWFLDINPDEPIFDHSSFSQNQQRLLAHKVADLFFAQV